MAWKQSRDVLTSNLGKFGRYQFLLCLMVSYYGVPSALNIMSPVFVGYAPNFRCNMTEDYVNNSSDIDRNACSRYENGKEIACDSGYLYDKSLFQSTIVTEFDMVCDRKVISHITTSIYMAGILIGSPVFGFISDRFGRKFTMSICTVCAGVQVIIMSSAPTIIVYSITRVLLGFFSYGVTLSTFVYVMELTTPKSRTFVGMASQSFFAIGYVMLSGIAYLEREWRKLLRFTALSYLPFVIFLFFIPESPRWLLTTGRKAKANKIINNIARRNGTKGSEVFREDRSQIVTDFSASDEIVIEKDEIVMYSFIDLFKTHRLRQTTIVNLLVWFTNGFVFYGISLNAGALNGDLFINHALNGVFQISGYFICLLTMDKFGHKRMLSIMFAISGIGSITSVLMKYKIPTVVPVLVRIFAFIGKLGISGAYAISYNFTVEMFPTVIRSNAIGLSSMASRVGGMVAPLIIATQDDIMWFPGVVFGVATLLSSVAVYRGLPETNEIALPELIKDGEML